MDVAAEARAAGLKTILKTNGYANEAKFAEMCDMMDAVNIDIKGTAEVYRDVCGIEMEGDPSKWVPIRNLKTAFDRCHCEASVIALPPHCRDEAKYRLLFMAMREATGSCLPVHILKFIPDFKLRHVPPTSDDEMLCMMSWANVGLFDYVYTDWSRLPTNTHCGCGQVLVERDGMEVLRNNLVRGRMCPSCKALHYFEGGER
jgi:pyruvate formate lyase activating enzyme